MRLKFGQRCFSYAAPAALNTLPPSLQQLTNTDTFKWQLKTSIWMSLFWIATQFFHFFKFTFQWTLFYFFYFIAFYYCKPLVTLCVSGQFYDWLKTANQLTASTNLGVLHDLHSVLITASLLVSSIVTLLFSATWFAADRCSDVGGVPHVPGVDWSCELSDCSCLLAAAAAGTDLVTTDRPAGSFEPSV